MHALRTTWNARLVASLLAACLLPAGVLVPRPTTAPAAHTAHAAWLRAQAAGEADVAFEQALEAATAARARTLNGFLEAFVEAHSEPETLGAVFAREGLSGEALVRDLQRGLLGLSGVPPQGRLAWIGSVPGALPASGRALGAGVLVSVQRAAQEVPLGAVVPLTREALVVVPVRLLWAARPLGP